MNNPWLKGESKIYEKKWNFCDDIVEKWNFHKKSSEVDSAWEVVQQTPVDLRRTDMKSALSIAINFNLYAYDAYYLDCAKKLHSPLLTLDLGMQRVARGVGSRFWSESS